MANSNHKSIDEILADPHLIEKVLQKAVRKALQLHRAMNNPVAVWQDGKVVWIQPQDIPIDEPAEGETDRVAD